MLDEKEAFRFAFDVVWKDRAFIPEVVQSFAIVHKYLRYQAKPAPRSKGIILPRWPAAGRPGNHRSPSASRGPCRGSLSEFGTSAWFEDRFRCPRTTATPQRPGEVRVETARERIWVASANAEASV